MGWHGCLFPYSMLLTRHDGEMVTPRLIVLAVLQFPLYGLIVGGAVAGRSQVAVIAALVGCCHVVAGICVFSGLRPNFT